MITFRPNVPDLQDSLLLQETFDTLGECIQSLINKHNESWGHVFKLQTEDIVICPYLLETDKRIGWKDTFSMCCVEFDKISDKEGYLHWFCNDVYDHPIMFFGYITTSC